MDSKRYVVVKGRFGMGGRVAVALSALRYARSTGRELIVDWNDYSYYSSNVADVFEQYWDQPSVSNVRLEALDTGSVYPPEWVGKLHDYMNSEDAAIMPYELSFFHPPDRDRESAAVAGNADVVVVTRNDPEDLIEHFYAELVPAKWIRERIEAFRSEHMGGQMIGVQIRHGNGEPYLTPAATSWFHDQIQAQMAETPDAGIFLATDSRAVVDEFELRYNNVVHTPKWYPPVGSGSMHQHPDCPDRFQNGAEAIVDIWLLKECSPLLLCKGFFGATARLLGGISVDSVSVYPGKIHATVAEKADWDNPI